MCKLKPLLSRWLEEADSAQGQLPQTGGDKHSQQVNKLSQNKISSMLATDVGDSLCYRQH